MVVAVYAGEIGYQHRGSFDIEHRQSPLTIRAFT